LKRERDFGRASAMRLKSSSQWPNSVLRCQELAARRRVEVQVATVTVVPGAACRGLDLADMRALGADRRAMRRLRVQAVIETRETEAMEERLAANPMLRTPSSPRGCGSCSCVARERERQVVARYAGPSSSTWMRFAPPRPASR